MRVRVMRLGVGREFGGAGEREQIDRRLHGEPRLVLGGEVGVAGMYHAAVARRLLRGP